ncbi:MULTISPECIES: universal stress protein [Myroides]|uniref:Universal stress protein n=1 Tax=Myroides albus TaxID=2562892 RepID=A0A6I3LHI4_9FLAO|nr:MULTISPECIES: universal stress protein [Myroides]MTG96610.1 universal stress protein [Myroides albus]MVX34606.1 universal stress protein [Myroides sp. LoEW2-1]UVD80977.1 universal stress protein [Myroides albus]
MKKILFPTDYSETANNAFKYALQLADQKDAELYVLHVYDPPVISGHISPHLVDNVIKKNEFEKLEQLHANSPILINLRSELNLDHVEVFFKVKEGLLIPEILNAIEEHEIDFVVMGTDGRNASFHKKLLGTNTLNTISKVTVPVLSVPKEATFKQLNNIIFTSLFNEEEQDTLDELVQAAENLGAKIKCVHIKQKNCTSCDEVYEKWKKRYENRPISFHIFTSDNTDKAILEFIQSEQPVDMVATIQRNKSFFESILQKSTTQHLAKHLKTPFFVYKTRKK